MKREEVIRMAREAGFVTGTINYADGVGSMPVVQSVATGTFLPELERFAALVAADEREACAKLADDLDCAHQCGVGGEVGNAIRARSQT